jgi:hypothetical protein
MIGVAGGTFSLEQVPGDSRYSGGLRNGMAASSWDNYHVGFRVVGAASASQQQQQQQQAEPTCADYAKDACSGTFLCLGATTCPRAGRPAWGGTDVDGCFFTGDSSPCVAARAAGAITAQGGRYKLAPCGASRSIQGFDSNGVSIRPWDRGYEACFRVLRFVADVAGHELAPPDAERRELLPRRQHD